MKIAVISDIHSNLYSLMAVLDDIGTQKPDLIIGAGDMVGCSAYSRAFDVWNILHDKKIPFVLGNEEARIIKYYNTSTDHHIKSSVQYMPLRFIAEQFSMNDIEVMKKLPQNILLDGPDNQNIYICHGSPNDINKSPMQGIDVEMEQDLNKIHAKVIVVGHLHTTWHQYLNGKLLIMAGSAGLPLRGKLDEVDYLVLTFDKEGWQFEYREVQYDFSAAVKDVTESVFLEQAGPIGWLMFDEILVQKDRLVQFFNEYYQKEKTDDINILKKQVINYLKHIERWERLKPYIHHLL
jgi:predicted phosphodiesterase